jgi:hypothetical protein
VLLFEKRSKNLCEAAADSPAGPRQHRQKFFGSFFKKELLTLLSSVPA